MLVKAAAHGIAQGTLAMMQNNGAGFLSGAAGGFFGSLGATAWGGANGKWKGIGGDFGSSSVGTIAFGAFSGGVGAELSGGNFWQGAIAGGIVAGLNDVMHEMGDDYGKPKPPKFRLRHLLGPDAVYVAGAENLGIGLGVGFEQGAIIILRGPDAGIYPAYDFGIGLSTASDSLSLEAVKLYYSGDTVTKDVFYGNRYEANFGADALGHIGFTGVYAPMADGNMVWGYGITIGVGFSATIFSGNINYGRTQTNGNNMIPNLVNKK